MIDEATLHAQLKEMHTQSYIWAMRCCEQNVEEAKDVMQTVYLKILQGKARFNGQSTFRTWLFAVIKYTASDLRRRTHRRMQQEQNYLVEKQREPREDGRLPRRLDSFRNALSKLPARQQEVLELMIHHEMTLEEIADLLNISVGSVRQHYHRAKLKVKTLLSQKTIANE